MEIHLNVNYLRHIFSISGLSTMIKQKYKRYWMEKIESSILFKEMFAISIYLLRLSPALLYVPSVTAILDRRLTPWGQKCRIQKDINKTRNQLTMKEDELWVGYRVRSLNPRIDRRLHLTSLALYRSALSCFAIQTWFLVINDIFYRSK